MLLEVVGSNFRRFVIIREDIASSCVGYNMNVDSHSLNFDSGSLVQDSIVSIGHALYRLVLARINWLKI